MLLYPAALPLSRQTLDYTARLIRRHRRQIGSPWRKLNPGRQALLVLAYLRKGETFAELAAGFGISTATAWRYVTETVALLAARGPKLRQALREASKARHAYLVIDGTLIPIDRVAADRPFYSGKHRKHGMNLQVIASPDGDIVWVSGPLPGAVHDLTAARIWGIISELAACGLVVLGDKGYLGEDGSGPRTGAGTSPPPRKTPTGLMPGCALPVSGPTPSSSPGASCASSAAAPGAPGNWPKPSTFSRPAKAQDESEVPMAAQLRTAATADANRNICALPAHGDAAAKLAADVVFCPAQGNRMLHLPAHGDRDAPGITACHGMTLIRQPYLVMSPPLRRCGRLCRPGWRSAALAHKPVLGRNVPGTSGA